MSKHTCAGGVDCENWQKGISTLVEYICRKGHITKSMEVKGHERWYLICSHFPCRASAVSDGKKFGWFTKWQIKRKNGKA